MKRRLRCLLVDLSWQVIPIAAFRLWLLKSHLDGCPDCQARLADRQEVQRLFPEPEARIVAGLVILAYGTGSEQAEDYSANFKAAGKSWPVRLYAGVTAALIIILLAGFGWYFGRQGAGSRASFSNDTNETKIVSSVSLGYVRSRGQPAATYIIRSGDPEMVIIWVETSN